MGKKTPFYEAHLAANAKMVDFFGWDMPLHYGSQLEEHKAVRQKAGMFDVSHMTIIDIHGPDVKEYLCKILANDVDRLKVTGKALYSCMLNERGGIIDDLIVYRLEDESYYRLVVNSATREKDIAWLQQHAGHYAVEINELTDLAMLAVQGHKAIDIAISIMPSEQADAAKKLEPFFGAQIGNWFISRTGYTGEDGFEIMLPAEESIPFWDALIKVGVEPCGLGARDTLRLEAGLNLSGTDMDETVTPLESNLTWTVAWKPENRNFIGRISLEKQKEAGIKRMLVGLVLLDRGVLHHNDKVLTENGSEGIITSGGFSPTLKKGIAMARVPINMGKHCKIEVRGKHLAAQIIKLPFVRAGKTASTNEDQQ